MLRRTFLASLLALALASPARASLVIASQEAAGTAHHSTTSPLSWSFTNSGTLLIVTVDVNTTGGTPTVSGVTYNGVSMTQATNTPIKWNTNAAAIYVFFLDGAAQGSNTVSVTWAQGGGTTPDAIGAAISFSGENRAAPVGSAVTGSCSSACGATASASVTGTIAGDYVVSAAGTGTLMSGANAPTTMSASLNNSGNDAGDNMGMGQQFTAGGSITAGYSITADQWGLAAVEIFACPGRLSMSGVGC